LLNLQVRCAKLVCPLKPPKVSKFTRFRGGEHTEDTEKAVIRVSSRAFAAGGGRQRREKKREGENKS